MENKEENKSLIEEVKNHILLPDEAMKLRKSTPYIFELTSGDKTLLYFGSKHTNDPSNPMFDEIKKRFNEFNPDVVIIEGRPGIENRKEIIISKFSTLSEEEIIIQQGEPGFALKLAIDNKIDFESPDPKWSDEIAHLLERGFSKDSIFGYYFFRHVKQFLRNKESDFDKKMNYYIENFKQTSDWQDFDYSITHANEIGKNVWGKVDYQDIHYYDEKVDPPHRKDKPFQDTEIKKVATESTTFRDINIVTRITEAAKNYKKVFVVYGSGHAFSEEPALRYLFENL